MNYSEVEGIQLDNLVKDVIYFVELHSNSKWLIKFLRIDGKLIRTRGSLASSHNDFYPSEQDGNNFADVTSVKSIREATAEESQWWEACNEAGRYVSKPEYKPPVILDNYEIF